jgi:hypothetical protein
MTLLDMPTEEVKMQHIPVVHLVFTVVLLLIILIGVVLCFARAQIAKNRLHLAILPLVFSGVAFGQCYGLLISFEPVIHYSILAAAGAVINWMIRSEHSQSVRTRQTGD